MTFSQAQVKGKIKNIAKTNNGDARILMRIYMMERFLERIASSPYSYDFIIKGGILVTSMIGVSMRTTMDIDTTIRNFNLTEADVEKVVREICGLDLDDGVTFAIKAISRIMDEMEYSGIRLSLDAMMDEMVTPIKIDVSTGDVITPKTIEYEYHLMLENRSIKLWSYNLETVLGEKLQTILDRGVLNTRMRDFYDVYMLLLRYGNDLVKVITGVRRSGKSYMLSLLQDELRGQGIKDSHILFYNFESMSNRKFNDDVSLYMRQGAVLCLNLF